MAPTGEHGVACGHPSRPTDAHGDAWGKYGTHRHLQGHVDAHSTHGRHTWDTRTPMQGRGTPTGDTWHPSSHPDQGHPGEPMQGNRNSSHPSHTPVAAPTRGTCRPQHSSTAPMAALPHSSDLCHPQQPPTAPMTTAPMTHSWHCSIAPTTPTHTITAPQPWCHSLPSQNLRALLPHGGLRELGAGGCGVAPGLGVSCVHQYCHQYCHSFH